MGYSLKAVLALATGLAFTALPVSGLPSSDYVLHESRDLTGTGRRHWKRGNRLDPNARITLRIGMTQGNLDLGYEKLMEVSDPSSKKYGKYLTQDAVHSFFAPADETIDAVHSWLADVGINKTDIRQYESKGWVAVDLPVSKIEDMFLTQYHEHERRGAVRVGCEQYSVPSHLAAHIDYIVPGIHLSPPMVKRSVETRPARSSIRGGPKYLPQQAAQSKPPPYNPHIPSNLQNCGQNFTVACYRALYDIPFGKHAIPGHEAAVYEMGDFWSQADLDLTWKKYTPYIPKGTHPKLDSVDGGVAPVPQHSPFNTGESDVDIAIIQPLIWPQKMVLYQVDDINFATNVTNASLGGAFNTWLDALDGSYCHSTAFNITGDSPEFDPSYPDPLPGGFKGPEMCGTYKPAKVISISYGGGEADFPTNYIRRQCHEFLKLGLQGTTVLVSSGDTGVAADSGDGTDSGCRSGFGQNQTIYTPIEPASCPYLTAVGATMLQPNQTILDPESAMDFLSRSGDIFSSGGGFSDYFPAPAYQKSTVDKYFAKHDPGHPFYIANSNASNVGEHGGLYNRNGRAYPDVSANGFGFRLFINGTDGSVLGTSLAAPLWNSIITLINQERAKIGKRSVGFINPVVYAYPSLLTDIKNGSNPNCGSSGYSTVEGWDPVTGLGTPKYLELLKLWLRLP